MRKSLRRFYPSLAASLFLCLLAGCGGPPDYRNMTEVAKAALITKLRKEAEEHFAHVILDPSDLDELKKYVDCHRETTRIAPGSCPRCYLNYGVAMTRLGRYYETLLAAAENELQKTTVPAEKAALAAHAARYRKEMRDAWDLSNRQFEVYFRGGEAVDPRYYFWVYTQCLALGDYRRAREYLDGYLANMDFPSPEDRQAAEAVRAQLQEQIERQDEEEIRRELEEDQDAAPARRTERGKAEPAN
ncbi:MAG: hypothetical protein HY721_03985 [Planctomycetes bacterium]|nr:hypothetical protein [Planctomycetota bacterium]